jgi:hypothetical protein
LGFNIQVTIYVGLIVGELPIAFKFFQKQCIFVLLVMMLNLFPYMCKSTWCCKVIDNNNRISKLMN